MFFRFRDEYAANSSKLRSVLDYTINITKLQAEDQFYGASTGK